MRHPRGLGDLTARHRTSVSQHDLLSLDPAVEEPEMRPGISLVVALGTLSIPVGGGVR